jgi:uncharacterized coiled-coil protein SlyX
MYPPALTIYLPLGALMSEPTNKEDYIDKLMRFIEEMVAANTNQARNSEDIKSVIEELKESNGLLYESNAELSEKIDKLSDCGSRKNCAQSIKDAYGKTFEELNKVLVSEAYELSKMILSLRKFLIAMKFIIAALGLSSLMFGIYKIFVFFSSKGGV